MSITAAISEAIKKVYDKITQTQKTETAQVIAYPGWDELIRDLQGKGVKEIIAAVLTWAAKYKEEIDKVLPIYGPELMTEKAWDHVKTMDATYGSLIAEVTAAEVTGMGQIETPALLLPHLPSLQGDLDAAVAIKRAWYDELFVKPVRYAASRYCKVTMPSVDACLDLYLMGKLSKEEFTTYLEYYGYAEKISELLSWTRRRFPDPSTILTMLRRGYITEQSAIDWLRLNRFPEETAKGLLRLKEEVPEPYRLADFGAKGLIDDAKLTSGFKWFGISEDWAKTWRDSQYQYPSISTAFELLWRGVIDEETFKLWMRRAGMPQSVVDSLMSLKEQIPPASDLITMVVREAFVPEWVTPAPDIFAKYMAMKGYSREWADRYWTAHWVRMPLTQAYACFYRGIWNEDRLRQELKYHDYHPYLIDDMVKVAYGIPSLRELGYGYDVGVYTKEDIEKYRRWAGLSPEDAKKATEALIAYRTEAERNALRTEYLYAYGRGWLSREELEAKLREVKTPEDAIPLWLERAELYRQRVTRLPELPEQRTISASEALSAFKLGLRDEQWLRQRLAELGWTSERIDLAVEYAKARVDEELTISASEAIDAFKKGLRDEKWLREQLKALRWADLKVQLAIERVKKEIEEKREYRLLTKDEMRKLYLMGKIDYDFIVGTYIEMGYRIDDAKLLAELTTYVEPTVEEPKALPTTAAEDLYYYGIFDEEDLWLNYRLQGYTEDSAWLLVMRSILNQEYPMLKKIYGEGAINDKQLYDRLFSIVQDEYIAMQLVQKIKYELAVSRLGKEKDLTKSEIIKGVKSGVISYAQGIELLTDIGYSPEEADFLLKINKVVAAGDPESYLEMKQVTEAFKKARGEPAVEIPEEAIAIELQIKEVRKQLDEARKHPEEEEKIKELALKLADLEARLRTVLAKSVRK